MASSGTRTTTTPPQSWWIATDGSGQVISNKQVAGWGVIVFRGPVPSDIPEFILNIVRPEIDMGEGASISSIGNGQDANWKRRIRKTIYRQSCGNVAGTPIIQRTDLNSFLSFLDQHFTLAVWTSAKKRTADSLVDLLFPRDIA